MDVMAMVKKLDQRMSTIEQILPTLATRDDLKAFATKEDLKAFATKEDLKAFATKEDLKAYPTRQELKQILTDYPTRVEMNDRFDEAKRFALVLHEDLKGDIALLAEHLADVMTRLPPRAHS
jgi:hypothetical protein